MKIPFSKNYADSFSRNIGIVTQEQQQSLLNATVAMAGLGGIGGATFLALVRMGVGHFHLADIDDFSIANINRQVGSSHAALGRQKIDVMREEALKINPEVKIKMFPEGVTRESVQDFIAGVDVVADCIDYFCLSPREILHEEAQRCGVTVAFSAPLAFSGTLTVFTKDSMSFKDYFDITEGLDPFEKLLRFTIGIVPAALHLQYMNFTKEQLVEMQTGPSIGCSVALGSSLLSAEIVFAITKYRRVFAAPYYTQFDLLRGKYVRKKLRFGNRGLLQRLKLWWARRDYGTEKEAFLKFIK